MTEIHTNRETLHATARVSDWNLQRRFLHSAELFAQAGVSVAVGNASDPLKAAADWVLPRTNREEAVATFLARVFL